MMTKIEIERVVDERLADLKVKNGTKSDRWNRGR